MPSFLDPNVPIEVVNKPLHSQVCLQDHTMAVLNVSLQPCSCVLAFRMRTDTCCVAARLARPPETGCTAVSAASGRLSTCRCCQGPPGILLRFNSSLLTMQDVATKLFKTAYLLRVCDRVFRLSEFCKLVLSLAKE